MTLAEGLGYLAGILVFSSFYMKTMIPLRYIAIASNLVYVLYGYIAGMYPMLILHALLLPLNFSRLTQMRRLIWDVDLAAHEDLSMDWLMPFTKSRDFKKGEVIAHKGDVSDDVYFIMKGVVRLKETNLMVGEGEIIGEIGVFAPDMARTCTMLCETDLETLTISGNEIKQLYLQNPRFGLFMTQLIVSRLIENQELLLAKAALGHR